MLINVFRDYPIGGCGLLIHKNMFAEIGLFDESMRYMQDIFEWEKAFLAGYGMIIIKDRLVKNRVHSKQVSTTGKHYAVADQEKIGNFLIEKLSDFDSKENNYNLLKEFLICCLRNNNINTARKILATLSSKSKIGVLSRIKLIQPYLYGILKQKLKPLYYKIKYNTKR